MYVYTNNLHVFYTTYSINDIPYYSLHLREDLELKKKMDK